MRTLKALTFLFVPILFQCCSPEKRVSRWFDSIQVGQDSVGVVESRIFKKHFKAKLSYEVDQTCYEFWYEAFFDIFPNHYVICFKDGLVSSKLVWD